MEDKSLHVNSIWKSNKTGDIVKILIEPRGGDQRVHYINLFDLHNDNDHRMMSHVDKAVFVAEHTFLRDNDNGALYVHDRNPNLYLKVIETTEKACMGARMSFVKYRTIKGDSVEEYNDCLIVTFHSCCHLLSLDPEKEYTVSNDSVSTKIEDKSLLTEGTWWKNKKTGEIGFITDFQDEKDPPMFKSQIIFRFQNGNVWAFDQTSFLREFEILPSHPESLPESNTNNECDKLQTHAIIPGSIYFNCVGGIHIVIPFKEESGVISFIMSDCLNDEVYFTTDIVEFIERYTLYQVFNKPDNGKAFDELVNKTKGLYDKIINKMNKGNDGGKVVKDRIIMGSTWINKKSKEKCVVTRIVDDMVEYCSQSDEIQTMCKECFVDEFEIITHDKSKRFTTIDIGSIWVMKANTNCRIMITDVGEYIKYKFITEIGMTRLYSANIKANEFQKQFVKYDEKYDEIPIGSIWKNVNDKDIVGYGRLAKIKRILDDIIIYTYITNKNPNQLKDDPIEIASVRKSFLSKFIMVHDNDVGFYYISNSSNNIVRVSEITPTISGDNPHDIYGVIDYTDPDEHTYPLLTIDEFHKEYKSLLDTMVVSGRIWTDIESGKDIVKSINCKCDKNGAYIQYIQFNTGIVYSMTLFEFLKTYELLQRNDMYAIYENRENYSEQVQIIDCFDGRIVNYRHYGGEFNLLDDENDVESFHRQYSLVTLQPSDKDIASMKMWGTAAVVANKILDEINEEEKEGLVTKRDETIMGNSKETYLKTDASKLEDFGTGAKREDKTGKGRYDLIPGDVMNQLEDFAWATYFMNGSTTCSATDVSKSAYFDDWTNVELYYDFIINVISYFFAKDHVECTDDCGEISYEVNWDIFRSGLYEMRKQLALHYEAGAAVHGVDNWKKGLPVYGSERGGCFLDSMRRHIDQALQGKDDEPHAIAAIWNAFGAVWTLKHRPHSAMYQNASAVKAGEYEKN